MSIYFSEKFKQLRKAHDLTQDQIANIFNISPQAVSRWETGATYPDIEILPHIAIYFNVTVDELLGTEKIQDEEKVSEYVKAIRILLNSGRASDATELGRKAAKEHPLNVELHYLLVQALATNNSEKNKDEIIAIGERIINLADAKSSVGNRVQLIRQYARWGMKEEAKKLLNTLPDDIWDAKEVWKGLILEGEEWLKNQQHSIIRGKYLLEYFIREYINKADLDVSRRLECKKAKVQIEELIDIVSGEKSEPITWVCEYGELAALYCEVGDIENALACVEKATRDSMHHIEQMDKTNDLDGSNYMAWATPRNLPWILWEDHFTKPQFDVIRNEEGFIKCFELLKSNSRELK